HTNGFSYGAWIKLQGRTGAVLSKMDDGPSYRGIDLLINDGKVEVHLVHQFPDNAIKVVSREPLSTNEWHHLFVTYDGSQKAAGVRVSLDAKALPVDTPNDKLSASIRTDAPLRIGSRTNAFPFAGLLDEVRIYDRPLRAEEVAELAAYPYLLIAAQPAAQR